ncbi:hypothetical protein [Peribacillus glennii]|nr:hypothetical protein [Peribacillus glennii]
MYRSGDITKIGLPKPTMMVGMLNDPELEEIAGKIEATLIGVLDKSK